MSRARNIKPGFFKNEDLVELPFEYRLLYIGLWTLADREGRLEDRPKRIKMEVFPADDVDIEAALRALHGAGFVQRYEIDGRRYVSIPAWKKHQNPHCREAASKIPPPPKASAGTVQAQCKHGTSPADSLIPDSLIQKLAVDTSTPDSRLSGADLNASGVDLVAAASEANPALPAVVRLRKRGEQWLRLTPDNPEIITAIREGVTVESIEAFAEAYPDKPPLYVIRAARREHAEGAQPIQPGACHASQTRKPSAVERVEAAIHQRRARSAQSGPAGLPVGTDGGPLRQPLDVAGG